jgi:RNA-directed DNA polymerase
VGAGGEIPPGHPTVAKFFDSVDHDLMVKAVEANTAQKWVVLYVRRWLTAQ